MINGALHLDAAPFDLGFEQSDALLQFLDRIGVEVLLAELLGKIVLAARKIFICVHHCQALTGGGPMSINAAILPAGKRRAE